jgi:integrase
VSLRRLLWAAYLTGFRQKDLRSIRREQITADGILVRQSKDGKHEVRQWTDSLRKLVRKELERSKCDWVFTIRSGMPWSMSGIQSAKRRLDVSWTFHDLRAKADSDHDTGLGLMRRYNGARRLRAVK